VQFTRTVKPSLLVLSLMHEATEAAVASLQAKVEADVLLAAKGDEAARQRAAENFGRLERKIAELGGIESLLEGMAPPPPEAP